MKLILTFVVTLVCAGCNYNDLLLMNPKGSIGVEQRSLILTAICLMLIVVLPAIMMTIIFSIKYRASNIKAKYTPDWDHSNKIELIVWLIPIAIIIILSGLTWKSTQKLDPNKPITKNIDPIVIEVIALDWKWLFIYPKQNIATINEIYFPINIPIKFKITSNSVMNAFFIPQLGSQIYAMAGMNANLNLIANKTGQYKGISSNFSGRGFSGMKFNVFVTKNQKEFLDWVKKVKDSPYKLSTIIDYERLSEQSEFHPVEYFSKVKPNLFHEVVEKFMKK